MVKAVSSPLLVFFYLIILKLKVIRTGIKACMSLFISCDWSNPYQTGTLLGQASISSSFDQIRPFTTELSVHERLEYHINQ